MCDKCPLRGAYGKKTIIGRLWRWHINFCPGWRKYYKSLNDQEREAIKRDYDFERCSQ